MSRLFWVGLGVVGAVYATRWLRRQRQRVSPANVGANVGDVVGDVRRLVGAAVQEARRAAAEKEAELRGSVLGRRRDPSLGAPIGT